MRSAFYEQAIGLYRDVGFRLGEANTLQGLGGLKEDGAEALVLYQEAHQLYQLIGDQYIAVSGRVRDTSTQEAIEINRLE